MKRIYIAEYFIKDEDTKRNKWINGFNAYYSKSEAEENAEKDFKYDFTDWGHKYEMLDFIINEIKLHNGKTA